MDPWINQFNRLYPAYKTTTFYKVCSIKEPGADSPVNFLQLDITSCNGEQFPYQFAGDSNGLYTKANSQDPMKFNCDGIFCTTYQEKNILMLCELKSKFQTKEICHAKEQIIGTLIRLKAQMSILQAKPDWEIHGVIASYEPTVESLTHIKDLEDYSSRFAKNIYSNRHKLLTAAMCRQPYDPLSVPDITIHYVGVPRGQQTYQIPLADILNL